MAVLDGESAAPMMDYDDGLGDTPAGFSIIKTAVRQKEGRVDNLEGLPTGVVGQKVVRASEYSKELDRMHDSGFDIVMGGDDFQPGSPGEGESGWGQEMTGGE